MLAALVRITFSKFEETSEASMASYQDRARNITVTLVCNVHTHTTLSSQPNSPSGNDYICVNAVSVIRFPKEVPLNGIE